MPPAMGQQLSGCAMALCHSWGQGCIMWDWVYHWAWYGVKPRSMAKGTLWGQGCLRSLVTTEEKDGFVS